MTAPEEATTEPFRMSRLSRHSLIYGIGTVLNRAVAFIMLPLYTRFLTPSGYGVLHLIGMFLEIATIFAGSRIAWGIFHFYHKAKAEQDRRAVLSTALSLLTLTYVGVAMTAFALSPTIADIVLGPEAENTLYVRLACAALAFEALVLVPFAHLQLRDRSALFVSIGATRLLLQVVLNVILLVPLRMGVAGVLLSNLIANVIVGLWLAFQLIREIGLRFSRSVATDLIRFGVPLVGMQISTVILTFGDRYFLNEAGDTAVVGIYGLAYQFGFLLVTLGYMPFAGVWQPARFEIAKRPDRDELYARVFVYVNVLLMTLAVGIALFTPDFLRIVAAPSFHGAAALVPVILLAYVFHVWTVFFNLGLFIKERTGLYALANWIAAGVALVGYLTLIPTMLAWGAALTTLIAFVVRHVIVYVLSQRIWPVSYRWGPVLRLLGAAALISLAGSLAPTTSIGVSLLLRTSLLVAYLVAIWVLDVFSEAERAFLRRAFRAPRAAVSALIG